LTTIYDHLFLCNKLNGFNSFLNNQIMSKLVVLLEQACNVDLSDETELFVQNMASFGKDVSIEYKSKYGTVSLYTKNKMLEVIFLFTIKSCNSLYIPFKATRCEVKVDNDLNFKQATFNFFVNFSHNNIELQVNPNKYVGTVLVTDPKYASIHIKRIINEHKISSNIITYDNFKCNRGEYINLGNVELNNQYFIPDNDFENLFVKFILLCSNKPKQFYTVFIDYPSYQNIIDHKKHAVELLNLFSEQYFNNFETLQSNMLLIDMVEI